MLAHVGTSNLIRDALVTERLEQPIKNSWGIVLRDRVLNAGFLQAGPDVIKECQRAGEAAHSFNQLERPS